MADDSPALGPIIGIQPPTQEDSGLLGQVFVPFPTQGAAAPAQADDLTNLQFAPVAPSSDSGPSVMSSALPTNGAASSDVGPEPDPNAPTVPTATPVPDDDSQQENPDLGPIVGVEPETR